MTDARSPGEPSPPLGDALRGRAITAPASTSNLGPGYDTLGLALDLDLRVKVVEVRDDGRGATEWHFPNRPLEGENSIERAFRTAVGAHGSPSLAIEVNSDIPIRAGLGSSAAAIVAGLRLAELVVGTRVRSSLLAAACRLEGHPDNTSACVLGGFVTSCLFADGHVVARSTRWPATWRVIVATPALALETRRARAALPATVPISDAVFNMQRLAMLLLAVQHADGDLLRGALDDRLHQPYRAPLVPGLREALAWHEPGLLGTFLSGAGPSIAAVVDLEVGGACEQVQERFRDLYGRLDLDVTIRALAARPPRALDTEA